MASTGVKAYSKKYLRQKIVDHLKDDVQFTNVEKSTIVTLKKTTGNIVREFHKKS